VKEIDYIYTINNNKQLITKIFTMKKQIGSYTVKLNANTNLITVTNNNEMIYGKAYSPHNSGSAYRSICDKISTKVAATQGS